MDDGHDPGLSGVLRRWLEDVADTTGTGVRALLVGLALVGAVCGALWWMSRQAPPPVEMAIPLVDPTTISSLAPADPADAEADEPDELIVHVAGAVVDAGVRRLPTGSRVIDAVEASGGLAADADADRINLAAPLVDGAQVYVPRVGESPPPGSQGSTAGSGSASSGPLDLNAATAEQLDTLPGIGPATAAAIIEHRERNGPFATVDALLDVPGIGEAKLAAIRDLVTV